MKFQEERFRLNRSRLKRDARSRSRSRSRSWERARRSRERERERDRRAPAYRNKSPPRRHERRYVVCLQWSLFCRCLEEAMGADRLHLGGIGLVRGLDHVRPNSREGIGTEIDHKVGVEAGRVKPRLRIL